MAMPTSQLSIHFFLQAAVKGGVALAFRKQQRKFILSEMGFILWAVQRRVLSTDASR